MSLQHMLATSVSLAYRSHRLVCAALLGCLVLGLAPRLPACPFCSAPVLTLVEQYEKADAVAVVKWVSSQPPEKERAGKTNYAIQQVLHDASGKLKAGDSIVLDRFRAGKPTTEFILLGTKGDVLEWSSPLEATPQLVPYLTGVPKGKSGESRLAYFLQFLEHPNDDIAADAYAQFANAPYKEILPLSRQFPREKLRQWILSPTTQPTRLGLYGLMLGLNGSAEDALAMEKKILEPMKKDDFRLGIDGVMGGYLLLTGGHGLQVLKEAKLLDTKVPFAEVYSVMQSLRFMWQYGNGRIPQEELRGAMRLLIHRPEMADLVIADLARWRDWSVQERLFELYGEGEYNVPSTRRAIIRYMIVSQRDIPAGSKAPPAHVTRGKELLEKIRQRDPKLVADVERFPPL